MKLNVTLFVQVANFWITCFFLSKFLWKPMVCMLDKRDSAKKKLQTNLQQQELSLSQRIEEKDRLLQDFRLYLKRQYSIKPLKELIIPSEIDYKKNEADIKRLTEQTEKLLVKQVPHAY